MFIIYKQSNKIEFILNNILNINKMILGSPFLVQQENENIEFKEFTLETSRNYYTEDEVISLIKKGKFDNKLNKLIFLNIKQYLEKYIPKYYTSFCNAKLKSKLIIGVNDDFEITGIPFLQNLSENFIKNYIKDIIFNKIKGDKDINDFNIQIIKLKKDKNELYDTGKKLLEEYISDRDKRIKIFKDYNEKYKKWHEELSLKSGKLIYILEDKLEKKNLITYIKNNNGNSKIIKYLENNHIFKIPHGKIMAKRKRDKNDYIYWLTKYKDICMEKIKVKKPIKPYYKLSIDPYIILDKLSDLRYKFILNNNKVQYYIIIIEINGKNKKSPIYYYDNNRLIMKTRFKDMCI